MDKKILITGAKGFIGKNLTYRLKEAGYDKLFLVDKETPVEEFESYLNQASFIFHLAGENRPQDESDFMKVNVGLTEWMIKTLSTRKTKPPILFASSIQTTSDNSYGKSKLEAEKRLLTYRELYDVDIYNYRLPNLFGKWSRPFYNSVVSTFCYQIARNIPITIHDKHHEIELAYIDDIIEVFIGKLKRRPILKKDFYTIDKIKKITLEALAKKIQSFHAIRDTHILPVYESQFDRSLHATYLSYLEPDDFSYPLDIKRDDRGILAEILKSKTFGQIFVSRTKPGITRGNHYHHSKVEKFLVIDGDAIIRFRKIDSDEVIEYKVNGRDLRVLDIIPGYTHSIENIGDIELITLFWANELYQPEKPDTIYEEVLTDEKDHDHRGN